MSSSPQNKLTPEIRKDKVLGKRVIFSPSRAKRPTDFKSKSPQNQNPQNQQCPFCIGHEHECAPELFRVVPDENSPNWTIRVIQNLYPALDRSVESHAVEDHGGTVVKGFGFHDVVIETPVHSRQLWDLSGEEIGEVVLVYKRRIIEILEHKEILYVQVFKNHGSSAGASMSHSHSQIIALPIIPPLVSARLSSMKENFNQTGKCSLCEIHSEKLIIDESTHFISMVPFAAAFPFEMWIIPREHSPQFHELDNEKAADLGGLLRLLLRKMSLQLNNPPYNFMFHTSPFNLTESELPYMHWFLQIVPQLTVLAGFEVGSGCHINPVFPEDAAKVLREVNVLQ